jgi:hypothetical protein
MRFMMRILVKVLSLSVMAASQDKHEKRDGEDADHGDGVDDPVVQFHGGSSCGVVGAEAPG